MRCLLITVIFCLSGLAQACAEPVVKVINFTADWCPNCQILNPRLDEAIQSFEPGSIERVDLDVTGIRRDTPPAQRAQVELNAALRANQHHVAYLWDWYGGVTGIAVAVSADTGEPLVCLMRPMSTRKIMGQLRLAKLLAENGTRGQRQPDQLNCPVLN